jgi:hypothetical protein
VLKYIVYPRVEDNRVGAAFKFYTFDKYAYLICAIHSHHSFYPQLEDTTVLVLSMTYFLSLVIFESKISNLMSILLKCNL